MPPAPIPVPQQMFPKKRAAEEKSILHILIREAVYVGARGLPDLEYVRSLCRLSLNSVNIGDKYCSSEFVQLSECLASKYLELVDGDILCTALPGLGVVSPVTILFDMVNLATSMFSRSETLQVVLLHAVSPLSGMLQPFLVGTPSASLDHSGHAQAHAVADCLSNHAARFGPEALRQRLVAAVAGDGGVVRAGGSHPSTGAAEKLWPYVAAEAPEGTECVEWDKWHRCNLAFDKALQDSAMGQELYCVSKLLSGSACLIVLFYLGDNKLQDFAHSSSLCWFASPLVRFESRRSLEACKPCL